VLAELANTAGLVNARGAESCAARGGLDVFAPRERGVSGQRGSDPARHTRMDKRYDRSFRDVIRATPSTDLATLESLELRHAQCNTVFQDALNTGPTADKLLTKC
jgi:hypothetical protein